MTPLALSDAANEDVASSATSNTSKTRYTPSTTPEVANLSVVDGKKEKESKSTHNDASASVLNPEDYLPVGSLVLIKHEFGDISNLGLSDCAWTPINHVPGSSSKQTGKLVKDRWIHLSAKYCHFLDILAVRIYILPHDCGHRLVNRNIKKLQNVLARLLLRIDISREAWEGTVTNPFKRQSLCHARSSPSLFYIFNQLPSPAPEPSAVPNRYSRFAMQLLLEYDAPIAGQKTNLYRYQRRAIATMIERETSSKLVLDPRLVRVTSPASVDFFFDPVKLELFRSPRFFESYRGGILGESMGLGIVPIITESID